MVALCVTLAQVWFVLHCCLCVYAFLEAQFLLGVLAIQHVCSGCMSYCEQQALIAFCYSVPAVTTCTCSMSSMLGSLLIWIAPVCEYR